MGNELSLPRLGVPQPLCDLLPPALQGPHLFAPYSVRTQSSESECLLLRSAGVDASEIPCGQAVEGMSRHPSGLIHCVPGRGPG